MCVLAVAIAESEQKTERDTIKGSAREKRTETRRGKCFVCCVRIRMFTTSQIIQKQTQIQEQQGGDPQQAGNGQ